MIKSMTGYGKATLSKDLRQYQMEIKSVNHRYLDISIKMPRILSYLEEEIKKEISTKIKRGKIDVFVTFENNSAEGREIKINRELAKLYINELKDLAQKENISLNIEVTEITKYPDVLNIQNNQDDEIIKKEIIELTQDATEQLVNMRKVEGEKIAQDLGSRLDEIKQKVIEISKLSTGLIEEYVVKLEKRIKELLTNNEVEQSRLAQEVVIYADKCSVEEEITRLHIVILHSLKNSLIQMKPLEKS